MADLGFGYWLLYFFIAILVGGLIGHKRHRVGFGVVLSLLLGPVGWLIVALMPAYSEPIGGSAPSPRDA